MIRKKTVAAPPSPTTKTADESKSKKPGATGIAGQVYDKAKETGASGRMTEVVTMMEPYWHLAAPEELGLDSSTFGEADWTSFRDDGGKLSADEVRRLHKIHGEPVARNFFAQLSYDDITVIMTDHVSVAIFWYMASYVDSLDQRTRELLNRFFGGLTEGAIESVTEQNYPSGKVRGELSSRATTADGYANWCMNAVLGNIESAAGKDKKSEILDRAQIDRAKIVEPLEQELEDLKTKLRAKKRRTDTLTDEDKEDLQDMVDTVDWAKKPTNSQNANAAAVLGYAQRLGESKVNRSVCLGTLKHDITAEPYNEGDPFKFNGKNSQPGVLFEDFFHPNPQKMMLDAISGAPAGHYMFVASVAKHHSVTIFVEKLRGGPIDAKSDDYRIVWNDQYSDGRKKRLPNPDFNPAKIGTKDEEPKTVTADIGDGVHGGKKEVYDTKATPPPKGLFGRRLKGKDALVKKIFYLGEADKTDPRETAFWGGATTNYTTYTTRDTANDTGNTKIENSAEKQRCSNTWGITLWLFTPER